MSLGHALAEHEIGRHSPLGGRVVPANLLDRSCVVVDLAQLLRQRRAASAQEDDCCASGYRASAVAASAHRHFTNFFFSRTPDYRVKVAERFYLRLADHSARRFLWCAASRKFRNISMLRSGFVLRAAEIALASQRA